MAQSIEEAGALLGAAITGYSLPSSPSTTTHPSNLKVPHGLHSSFSIHPSNNPITELFTRLFDLRTLLRTHSLTDSSLPSAPSILAVLLKLLVLPNIPSTTPNTLDSSSAHTSPNVSRHSSSAYPPIPILLLSTPLRTLFVECTVICHRLGHSLPAKTRIDVYPFFKKLLDLAGTNPKSLKAQGSSRFVALECLSGIFRDDVLSKVLTWGSLELLQLCHRGLRSIGNNEPLFRSKCVETAICVLEAYFEGREGSFVSTRALEDKACQECVRILKRAQEDKFPEVRCKGAVFAGALSGLVVIEDRRSSSGGGGGSSGEIGGTANPLVVLEEVVQIALKNLDDESVCVAMAWADSLARSISVAVEYAQELKDAIGGARKEVEVEGDDDPNEGTSSSSVIISKIKSYQESRRNLNVVTLICSSLPSALEYLVDSFVKAGGELMAFRCGSTYSAGGRYVRAGYAMTLVNLCRLQSSCGNIGPQSGALMSLEDVLSSVLNMVGPQMEKQLVDTKAAKKTGYDAGLARLAATRVLRRGLGGAASEAVQLIIVRHLATFCSQILSTPEEGALGEALDMIIPNNVPSEQLPSSSNPKSPKPNRQQLQVALIELSHLVSVLGQASISIQELLLPTLHNTLTHPDSGVRLESSILLTSLIHSNPSLAPSTLIRLIMDIQSHKSSLMDLASQSPKPPPIEKTETNPKRRFRSRNAAPAPAPQRNIVLERKIRHHQSGLTGNALAFAMCIGKVPRIPHADGGEGLHSRILDDAVTISESLVEFQFHEKHSTVCKKNPQAGCALIRGGYQILTSVLSIGSHETLLKHFGVIFQLFQKSSASLSRQSSSDMFDLINLESLMTCLISFLRFCPEALLTIPDALNRITRVLEDLIDMMLPQGRMSGPWEARLSMVAIRRFDSCKGLILEAFSWLPPGSFPVVADKLFLFSSRVIMASTEGEITSSLLPCLVSSEDTLLDAISFPRITCLGQSNRDSNMDDALTLISDPVDPFERETIFLSHITTSEKPKSDLSPLNSPVMALLTSADNTSPPPTPLHNVGAWKEPPLPSPNCKIRLLDSAITVFATSFGMQDGGEQERLLTIFESLLPPSLNPKQKSTSLRENLLMTESERLSKINYTKTSSTNITVMMLACVKALPFHESSFADGGPSRVGPPWMNKAKDLFLALLPSGSNWVRRGAAEGLAALACLGVREDAHTLQSVVLRSLDEVMTRYSPPGGVSGTSGKEIMGNNARSGAILALACLQRTHQRWNGEAMERSNNRTGSRKNKSGIVSDPPPTRIMITRVLSALNIRQGIYGFSPEDAMAGGGGGASSQSQLLVRAFGLHSYGVLMSYWFLESDDNSGQWKEEEKVQIVRKGAELVEDYFVGMWTAVSGLDKGKEIEKFSIEPVLLSVLIRLMNYVLLHWDAKMKELDPSLPHRFCDMTCCILECCDCHPTVVFECLSLFERMANLIVDNQEEFKRKISKAYSPFLSDIVQPITTLTKPKFKNIAPCQASVPCLRAAIICVKAFADTMDHTAIRINLFALLEIQKGKNTFAEATDNRRIVIGKESSFSFHQSDPLVEDITSLLESLPFIPKQNDTRSKGDTYLRWILFLRIILSGSATEKKNAGSDDDSVLSPDTIATAALQAAHNEASLVLQRGNPSRWQVKTFASKLARMFLEELVKLHPRSNNPHFDLSLARSVCAKRCREANHNGESADDVPSYAALHLNDLLGAACTASVSALDTAELRFLQNEGIRLLSTLEENFADCRDPDARRGEETSVLTQFASQMTASIKLALGAEMEGVLFSSGCEALRIILKKKVIQEDDPIVLRRLIRPLITVNAALKFGQYPGSAHGDDDVVEERLKIFRPKTENGRMELIRRVSSLVTLFDLDVASEMGVWNGGEVLRGEMEEKKEEFAIHACVLALDAVRVLRDRTGDFIGVSLSSSVPEQDESRVPSPGFTFGNLEDVGDTVERALMDYWPVCAAYAMTHLLRGLEESKDDVDKTEIQQEWLRKVSPILFLGLHNSLSRLGQDKNDKGITSEYTPEETASICVYGIRSFIKKGLQGGDNTSFTTCASEELGSILQSLLCRVLLPGLGLPSDWGTSLDQTMDSQPPNPPSKQLISQTCGLLEDICQARKEYSVEFAGDSLLRCLLVPLTAFQEKCVFLEASNRATYAINILSSCLCSAKFLLGNETKMSTNANNPTSSSIYLKSMLHLSLSILQQESSPSKMKEGASALFDECLNITSIAEKQSLARDSAKIGRWDAWGMVCANLQDGSGITHSLDILQTTLANLEDHQTHRLALTAIRVALQDTSPESQSDILPSVMNQVGPQVLQLLNTYGMVQLAPDDILPHRTLVCADAMRILLLSFQNLISTNASESIITSYLQLLIRLSFIPMIQFNGLPNDLAANVSSDPALGRMCAQAIVHIARGSPAVFKASMIALEPDARTTLETAVRAEMTGYASNKAPPPLKKRLNLKGFSKA